MRLEKKLVETIINEMEGVRVKNYLVSKNSTLIEIDIDCVGKVNGALFFLKYQILIEISNTFPVDLPTCRESGKKKKIKDYHHINRDDDFSFCLGTNIELHERLKPDYSLKKYIKIIIEFLTIYEYFAEYRTMPVEERSHGTEGLIEGYISFFNINDVQGIVNLIKTDKLNNKMRNQQCPCNSGKKFKKCHFNQLTILHKSKNTRAQMISELPILERIVLRNGK